MVIVIAIAVPIIKILKSCKINSLHVCVGHALRHILPSFDKVVE